MSNMASTSMSQERCVDLVFRDICATLGGRQILHNVSGMVKQGTMLAIMGSSGTGKTTLLNTIAGRITNYTGDILINNQPITKQHRRRMGYALQQDIFFPNLTLRQTLKFSALLRLSDDLSYEDKMKRCEEVIDSFDLHKCIDTQMGGPMIPGLSGGERKRAAVACEVLSDPSFILIDEPTSGLDSALALQVMTTLKNYATDQNKTIVTTIHQPSSQIFHMFQNVLLLADGQMAYYGNSTNVVPFFAANGLHCDVAYNPADFILDQVTKDKDTRDKLIKATTELRSTNFWPKELHRDYDFELSEKKSHLHESKWPTSFWTQFKVLMQRNLIQSAKSQLSIQETVAIIIGAAASILLWWRLPRTEDTIESRKRFMWFVTISSMAHILFGTIQTFPTERSVINKERLSGTYRLSAYYLSKTISEIPVALFFPTLHLSLTYFLVGLTIQPDNFVILLLTLYVIAFISQGLGFTIGICFLDLRQGMLVAATFFNIAMAGSGLLKKNFHWYLDWIRYVSYVTYGYDILLHTEFEKGDPFECSQTNSTMFSECLQNDTAVLPGDLVLERTENVFPLWLDLVVLLGIMLLLRIIAYLLLRYIKHPGKHYKNLCLKPWKLDMFNLCKRRNFLGENGNPDNGIHKGNLLSGVKFNLTFKDISARLGGKLILEGVSGYVKHGTMMAVLGPSGVGKTTLLNVLAGRIVNYTGQMTVNNHPINKQIRRKMGYVLQQDIFFNNLTLLQTLQFTSKLRLPEALSFAERESRLWMIINRFDLTKCLDTRMEVLSGGEKKRANIACELLADPALLLVDEPTTGLDSSLAFEMMKTLQCFASELDKAIVTTIHQPASHIFHMFEKILLLANGQVVFNGKPQDVLKHFSSIGLHCNPLYNPADFIMEQLRISEDVTKMIIKAADEHRKQWEGDLTIVDRKLYDNVSTATENGNVIGPAEVTVFNEETNGIQCLSYVKKDPENLDTVILTSGISLYSKQTQEDEKRFFETNRWPTRFWTQYKALTYRNFLEAKGRFASKIVIIGQAIVALIMGLVWWQITYDEQSIIDIQGMSLFNSTHWIAVYMTDALLSFYKERIVINKERLNGTYRLSAYWFAKMTSEIPILFMIPTFVWLICYFMIGLPLNIGIFLATYLINILTSAIAQSFGLFIGALVLNFKNARYIAFTYFIVSVLAGGFFVSGGKWMSDWMKYLSMAYYPYILFLQTLIESQEWKCAPANQTIFPECRTNNGTSGELYVSGDVILGVTEPNVFPFWINTAAGLAMIIIFRLAAYLVLRYIRNPSRKGIK